MATGLEEFYEAIIRGVGEDPGREGLQDTPGRAARAMQYLTRGYGQTVEEVVNDSGLVELAVAVGVADPVVGHRIGLAIVRKGTRADIDFAIRHICARELPPYMQPQGIVMLDEIPLLPNGKPDRHRIVEEYFNA